MNAQAEEDDRIDRLIADADWCKACDAPIGMGTCDGCFAVACVDAEFGDWPDDED